MSLEKPKLKEKIVLSYIFGTPPFILIKILNKKYDHNAIEALAGLHIYIIPHLTFFGFWYGATYGIAKHAFHKDTKEALKIAGVATATLFGCLAAFFIADLCLRTKKGDVFGDLLFTEAILCPPATLLGYAQIKIYEACNER
jgi:hypothetical protein